MISRISFQADDFIMIISDSCLAPSKAEERQYNHSTPSTFWQKDQQTTKDLYVGHKMSLMRVITALGFDHRAMNFPFADTVLITKKDGPKATAQPAAAPTPLCVTLFQSSIDGG